MSMRYGGYLTFEKQDFGSGGFGRVFLAKKEIEENQEEKKLYVIKVLQDEAKNFEEHKLSFNNEIDILDELRHIDNHEKYVPTLFDFKKYIIKSNENNIQTTEAPYLVIDYFSNCLLFDYIKCKKQLEEKHKKLVFKKIVESVQFLHNNNICHLDIKPENIIFDEEFNPIIIDYGYSKKFRDANGNILTLHGGEGTNSYRCPEIWENGTYDGVLADIFSLGVVLFNLVTKIYGFFTSEANDVLYCSIKAKKYDEYWEKIKKLNNQVLSDDFKKLYIGMVQYNPSDRMTIDDILNSSWLNEIQNEGQEFENKVKGELQIISKIITSNDINLKNNNDIKEKGNYKTRSSGDDSIIYFDDKTMTPKNIPNDRKIITRCIKINGNLRPIDFMNSLANAIIKNFKEKCDIHSSKEKLQFKVEFSYKEEDELKMESGDCTMEIELFQYEEGRYLLEFVRREGEMSGYYNNFMKIKNIINMILQ